MKKYPRVFGEVETLQRVVAGASLARYGDGEFKMASRVVGIKSQVADERLSGRLASILTTSGSCLVGVPNIHAVIDDEGDVLLLTEFGQFQRSCDHLPGAGGFGAVLHHRHAAMNGGSDDILFGSAS